MNDKFLYFAVHERFLQILHENINIFEVRSKFGNIFNSTLLFRNIFGGPVDLGASIITGLRGNPITLLSSQVNGPLYHIRTDACPIYDADGM